jgi:hypothetical protein
MANLEPHRATRVRERLPEDWISANNLDRFLVLRVKLLNSVVRNMGEFSHKSIRASTLACEVLRLLPVLPLVVSLIVTQAPAQTIEIIAGITLPIPPGMRKATDKRVELIVPGFKGGQEAYRGDVDKSEVITFYQKQMPLDGWNPYASLVTEGGLLVYTRNNQSVLILVGEGNGETTLAIMVGTTTP